MRAFRRVAVLFAATLFLGACFEEPVTESMTLTFHPDGTYALEVETVIADPGNDDNLALTKRLAELRRSLDQGSDPWSRRFELLEPGFDRLVQERAEGVLVRVERSAEAEDHEALRRFLADAGLTALIQVHEREVRFEIVPGGSLRASRSQRDQVHALLSSWSEAVARTYGATAKLYATLATHPERARACLSALFAEALPEEDRLPGHELSDADRAAIDAVRDARKEVVAIFEVAADEAYSPNELSHLVYDPFPARLSVKVGAPLEVVGFEKGADGALVVSGLGLFEALETLGGVWASPDPLVSYVRAARSRGSSQLSLEELAAQLPRAAAPSAGEVREALEARLRPAPVYRVVFTLATEPAVEEPATAPAENLDGPTG